MLNQPNFNPAYLVETVEPDTVFLYPKENLSVYKTPFIIV
jgi:hypothetical protein